MANFKMKDGLTSAVKKLLIDEQHCTVTPKQLIRTNKYILQQKQVRVNRRSLTCSKKWQNLMDDFVIRQSFFLLATEGTDGAHTL